MKTLYTPLHCHSDASLDGAGTVQALVQQAAKLGFQELALTDHGTLANAVAFWSACQDYEIKPILGLEAYLSYGGKRHHITLLSYNETGFNNLVYLNNFSHEYGYTGGYPTLHLGELGKRREGIFALTGCASSALYVEDEERAKVYVADLMDTMGRTNVALEMMFLGSHDCWSRPIRMAHEFSLPIYITNDTHYPCREQHAAHQTICSARRGFTYDSQHLWLKTWDEIAAEGGRYIDGALVELGLRNTKRFGEMVESWDMRSRPSLPHIENVEKTLEKALKFNLKREVERKGGREVRLARLRSEFRVLHDREFLDYIYILWDIVSWAKMKGIAVGPGRGSGGGSYVLYLLGITSIDPIEHGLMFERFLNPARGDYPDVDVDFEADRRGEVLEYASKKWGMVPIATYSTYSHKSAVHDIARTLAIPKDLEKLAAEAGQDSEVFTEFINQHKDALPTYSLMMGQIRHRGKHAAGVILPNRPVPIERAGDNLVAAWAEGGNSKDLSRVGIVKYDLLGLTALSQLKQMKWLTGEEPPKEDYNDPAVYNLFCEGDVAGIFQWSGSDGIRELTTRIAPRRFSDLVTCNALYRPGALHAGTAEHYPEFMREPRRLHPRIDPLLEETYGVICYQEQVMAIVAEVLSGDLSEADVIRRLISKASVGDPKWEAEIERLRLEFVEKGLLNGFPVDLLGKLWHEIYTHSGYSYNLSHATAYTSISYQMAWYKVYHRAEFTLAVLQHDRANAQTYILDAVEHGLAVEMPNINYSSTTYEIQHAKTIFLPLTDVAFLGERAAEYIVEERERNGLFVSYEDFAKRIPKKVCNNRAKTYLERIGAFSDFEDNPASAIDKYEEIEVKDSYETQLEVLGYVVPSRTLWAKMKKVMDAKARKGYTRFAGFISEIKKKRSIYGEYTVYSLSPEGSFWMRGEKVGLKVGAFVSGTKNRFGKSNDCKIYRLGTGD